MDGTLEALQTRHRKEQRDLQSRITNKKKNATKKTRKGVNDECATLERELKERQANELAAFNGGSPELDGNLDDVDAPDGEKAGQEHSTTHAVTEKIKEKTHEITQKLKDTTIYPSSTSASPPASTAPPPAPEQASGPGKKRNRQKERMARRAAEQEAAAAAAEREASGMTDHRGHERAYMEEQFGAHQLAEHEVAPDGHCLFSAVADQLAQQGIALDERRAAGEPLHKTTRRAAADYMRAHPDDFAPFLPDAEGGNDMGAYARMIEDTAEWGGQLELAALAAAYKVEIMVVQDGRTETIHPAGADKAPDSRRIWLAYYRHGYGLGEHYNSLRKKG
ncbi:hypothetical protein F4780DRAFT_655485 [Xylariomycetidae sp. FL0641]|nr:hypothetical protein F4780DRAFT_655485 [Xylariomycetidae sp. FL0641]